MVKPSPSESIPPSSKVAKCSTISTKLPDTNGAAVTTGWRDGLDVGVGVGSDVDSGLVVVVRVAVGDVSGGDGDTAVAGVGVSDMPGLVVEALGAPQPKARAMTNIPTNRTGPTPPITRVGSRDYRSWHASEERRGGREERSARRAVCWGARRPELPPPPRQSRRRRATR
jgi:hypothetical protein